MESPPVKASGSPSRLLLLFEVDATVLTKFRTGKRVVRAHLQVPVRVLYLLHYCMVPPGTSVKVWGFYVGGF